MDKHHPTASMDTPTDYRALCQELASLIKTYPPTTTAYWAARKTGAWQRACAALAEPEPEGPSDEDRTKAAFAMGQTGAPSSETERLAFESWMRGHSWLVQGVWNGTTYDDRGPSRVSSVDVGAMQTRMLWAAWRDRAALACLGRPAIEPVPASERPWEREGWCDAENRCYGWDGEYWWMIGNPEAADETITHWLPHYAMPVPNVQP
jgi:hypothetical protein